MSARPGPPPPSVADALHLLQIHRSVSLPGRPSDPFRRLLRVRRRMVLGLVGLSGAGAVAVVVGLGLRDVGLWSLLIVFGGFCAVPGGMAAVVMWC